MTTAIAIGLAVLGAVGFAAAAYLQHDAVRGNRLRHAVRQPAWLAGLLLIGVAATVHAVALALAPLVVVQPIGVLALPLVAALHVRASGARLGGATRAAIGATAVGVAAFVAVAATVTTSSAPSDAQYVRACWFVGFAVLALVGVGVTTAGRVRCVAYAAAAGVAFALVSVLVRAIGVPVAAGTWQVPLVAPIGIVAALLVGGALVQLGYTSGPPAVVIACLTIVDPLASVGVGAGLLGEASPATNGWTLLAGTASALLAIAGTVALARHHPEVAARTVPQPGPRDQITASDNHAAAGSATPEPTGAGSDSATPAGTGVEPEDAGDVFTASGPRRSRPPSAVDPGSVRAP